MLSLRRLAGTIRVVLLLGCASAAAAQDPAPAPTHATAQDAAPSTTPPAAADRQAGRGVAPDSPRAALDQFFKLCRKGRWDDAGRFLLVPEERSAEAGTLARRLKAVFDRHQTIDLDTLSPRPEGNEDDGLPAGVEDVGRIRGGGGESVRVVRVTDGERQRWVFSQETVERIDDWFDRLPDRWVIERLPPALLRPGPLGLALWQWLALPVLALLAWIAGWVLGWLTRAVLGHLVKRTDVTWDDMLLAQIAGPLMAAWTLVAGRALVPLLGLSEADEGTARDVVRGGLFVVFFWALLRSVDVLRDALGQSEWSRSRPGMRSLLPLAGRVLKVVLLGMGLIGVLGLMGFPVASLIAGFGIGGIALALAAQKTGENLVAAFSIGVDQHFSEGDLVRVDDIEGVVESIGLRSTRIRTHDRTLVTLPNGRLAEMRLESLAARDRIRFVATLGLVYGTTAEQVRRIRAGLEQVLRAQPELWPDVVLVDFVRFGESSLDIEVVAWFRTTNGIEFRRIRERVLLAFMDVVEREGSDFAFPTRTVHVAGDAAAAGAGVRDAGDREAGLRGGGAGGSAAARSP